MAWTTGKVRPLLADSAGLGAVLLARASSSEVVVIRASYMGDVAHRQLRRGRPLSSVDRQ